MTFIGAQVVHYRAHSVWSQSGPQTRRTGAPATAALCGAWWGAVPTVCRYSDPMPNLVVPVSVGISQPVQNALPLTSHAIVFL